MDRRPDVGGRLRRILVAVLIRIEAHDLPGRSCGPSPERPGGHHGIEVGVQRKNKPGELLGQVSADVESVVWEVEATPVSPDGADFRGPYISGPPGGRFIYLSWGVVEQSGSFDMFRRAKIMFDGIPPEALAAAQASGVLIGRLGLTDPKGNPTCAAVRPPLIEWLSDAKTGELHVGCVTGIEMLAHGSDPSVVG